MRFGGEKEMRPMCDGNGRGKMAMLVALLGMLLCGAANAVTVTATTDAFRLSIKHDGIRQSGGDETLTYSGLWNGGEGATVTIAQDGATLVEGLTGEGERAWSVTRNGTYVLTHTTYTNGVAGKVEAATFVVAGKDVPFAEGDVTVSGYEAKYDGAAHGIGVTVADGIENVAVKYATALDGEFAATLPTLTDVGSMTVWCEIAAPGYITQTNSATITITKRAVTLTSGDASKVYDGTALVKHEVAVSGDGFIDGEGASCTYTGSQTGVGTSENAFTYALNEGTKAGNYTITTVNGALTVTKAAVGPGGGGTGGDEPGDGDVPQGGLSKFDATAMYDGEGHTIDTNALAAAFSAAMIGEIAVEYAVDDGSGNGGLGAPALPWETVPVYTNAGEYVVWYRVSNPNYEDFIHAAKVTITNRPVTVTSSDGSWKYDGQAHSNATVTAEGFVDGEGIVANNFATITDMGSAANSFGYAFADGTLAGNYAVTCMTGTLTVAAAGMDGWTDDAKWSVTLSGDGAKYDGTEKTCEVTALAYDGFAIPTFTVTGNTATDAGDYTLTVTGTGNFSGSHTFPWSIVKRAVTLTSGDASKVYDGTPVMCGDVLIAGDGFVTGEGATFNVTGSQTSVGTSENTFTYTLNEGTKAGNYDITTVNGTLTVTKASAGGGSGDEPGGGEVPQGGESKFDTTFVYDGEGHTIDTNALAVAFDGAVIGEFAVEYAKDDGSGNGVRGAPALPWGTVPVYTNAGEYVVWYLVANPNYEDFIHAAKVTITNRPVTVTSSDGSWTYDGQAHSNATVTAEGFVDGEGIVAGGFAEIVDVGTAANAFTYAFADGTLAENYAVTCVTGTLTVASAGIDGWTDESKWSVTLSGDGAKYDGTEKTCAVTALAYDGFAIPTFTVKGNTATDAGDYTLTVTGTGNFSGSHTFPWSIVKRAVTLTSGDASKVYDGSPVLCGDVHIAGDGFVAGEGASYNFTGSQTDVGTSENTFTYTLNEGTKASNYDISTVNGTLTVTKASAGGEGGEEPGGGEVPEGGESKFDATFMYDGEGHTIDTNALAAAFGAAMIGEIAVVYAADDGSGANGGPGVPALPWGTVPAYTNAGEYVVWYRVSNPNYDDFIHAAKVTITNRPVTVTVVGQTATFDYDTTEKSVAGCEATTEDGLYDIAASTTCGGALGDRALPGGVVFDGVEAAVRTDVGTTAMGLTAADFANSDANFLVTYLVTDGWVKVNPRVIGDDPANWDIRLARNPMYDGTVQTAPITQVAFVKPDGNLDNIPYTLSGNTATDAGNYVVRITGSGNYSGTVEKKWAITPRNVTLTSGGAEWTYDGTAHSETAVTVGGDGFADGEGASYSGFPVVRHVADAATPTANAFTYALNANTKAGNYSITTANGTVKMLPRAITLAAPTKSKPYDGSALTFGADEVTATLTGGALGDRALPDGEAFTLSSFSSITEAGRVDATFTVADGTALTGDYAITTVPGSLTVTRSATEITVTAKSGSWTYDGQPHSLHEYEATNLGTLQAGDALEVTFSDESVATTPLDGPEGNGVVANVITGVKVLRNGTDDVTANYTLAPYNGTLTVTRRPVTLTSKSDTKVYDGEPLTAHEVTVGGDGFVGEDGAEYTFTGSQTEKGTSKNSFSYTLKSGTNAAYYDITKIDGDLEVTAADISQGDEGDWQIVLGPALTYTGLEQIQTLASVTYKGLPLDYSVTGNAQTDAGTYQMTLTGQGNFSGTHQVAWSIAPKALTLTAGSGSRVYDGTVFTVGAVTASGFVAGEGAIYQCAGSQTAVGSSANEISAIGWNANTKASNYAVTKVAGTLTVTPRPVTLTAANLSKPYDGTPLALTAADITASGIVAGESFTYSDFASRTEAGQTPATFSYAAGPGTSLDNYSVTVTPGRTITITRSATAISVTAASESWVYDGEAHSNRTWTATNLSTLQAGDELEVTFDEASVVTTPQDGPAQDGVVANVITGVRVLRISGGPQSLAAEDVTANYSVEWFPGTLTVTKRPVAVTVTGHTATYTYDGTEKMVEGFDIATEDTLYDVMGKTHFGGVSFDARRTAVGISQMNLAASQFANSDANFEVTYAVTDGWVKINPLDIAAADDGDFALVLGANPKYNGTVQTIPVESVTCGGLPVTYTLAGENATHAGTYTLTVKANGNFTGERSTTWQVLKRAVTLTSGSASKVYDGTPLANANVAVGGDGFIGIEGATFVVTGSQTVAGTGKNTFTYTLKAGTLAGDYEITKVDGDLTVTKAKYPGQETGGAGIQWNVAADAATWMYDGAQHGVGLTGVPNGVTPHLSGCTATDVGSYTASVTFDYDAANYEPPVVPAPLAWSITKRPITLMAASKDKPYDGFPLEVKPGDITDSGSGYAPGECFDYYDMASITEVGEIPATFSYRDSATAKVSNYAVTVVGGQTLKVTVGGDQISVTADSATWAYDGTAHSLPTWTVFNGDKLLVGHELQVKVSEESAITTPKDGPAQDGIVSNRFEYVRIVETATGADKTRNYNLLVYDGTLQITNRVICSGEVIVNSEGFTERIEKVYDGVATGVVVTAALLQPATVRYCGGRGATALPECAVWSNEPPEFTDAGDYTVWYEIAADYYDAYTGRVDVAIAKRPVKFASPSKVKNYDGGALTFGAGEIDVALIGGALGERALPEGESFVFCDFASITDAGRVDATFDYAAGANTSLDNYEVTVVNGTLTVRASADEIAVTAADGTWMYDGAKHFLHGYAAENVDKLQAGDELVVSFSAESVVTTPEDGPLADGAVSNVITSVKVLRGGTEDVTRNYSLVWYPGTLTVTKARMTVDDASFATAFTYDGEGHTIALTPPTLLQPTTVRYGTAADAVTSVQPPKFTDAGIHTVFFTIAARYYETYVGSAAVTIAPRSVTLVSAGAEKVYDGTPLRRDTVTVKDGSLGFADGEGVETTCTGSLTDVGGMENLFDYSFLEGTKADNYAITKEYGWLRVTPAALDTAPIGAAASFTLPYDGEGHAFTVGPGVEPARAYYALVAGDESAYTNEAPMFTNATAEAVAVYFKILSPNYEPAYGTGTVWITKAVITPPEIPSKAYTGEPQAADVPESALWTVQSNPAHVPAGSYRITLRMKDFANMKWSNSSSQDTRLTFKIVRSANEWTVAPSITEWTEGQPSNDPVAESKYGEVRVTYSGTTATGETVTDAIAVTAAGQYTAVFEVDETENWSALRREVRFTVTGRAGGGGDGGGETFTPLTYTARGYVGVYDGTGHSISVDVIGGDGDHVLSYALSQDGPWQPENPEFVEPGTRKVWFRIESANFETVVGSATVSIAEGGMPVKDHVDVETAPGERIVAIPYSWFMGIKGLGERFGTNWDAVAHMPTGKKDAAGNALSVWHDYVAGTDPMNVTDCFHATISVVGGMPVIRWHPALNDTETQKGVKTGVRVYRVMGACVLDGAWAEVPSGEEKEFKFFKVTVEMP